MRLINTKTLALTEHPDSKLPESGYAILSHRWLDASDEVTFEDLQHNRDVSHKVGFAKLKNFCSVAASQGLEYAWCDTCCIDKASSVELGSAINSMYRWYKNAKICVAYLQDVYEGGGVLEDSEWFERGWTLQELIAPTKLEFFNRDWESLGTKTDNVGRLFSTTGIPVSVLRDTSTLFNCSIAQRMSWAANRTTERLEDRAYSLLGLFDISLEMIYGEQEKAFIRLQEKIIQQSADQSIFAWAMDADASETPICGLFATSPSAFHACQDIIKGSESQPFSTTNVGLSISLVGLPYHTETYLVFLDCFLSTKPTQASTILLTKLTSDWQWARTSINGISITDRSIKLAHGPASTPIKALVRQHPTSPLSLDQTYGFWLRTLTPPFHEKTHVRILSRTLSPYNDYVLLEPGTFGTAGIISFEPVNKYQSWSRPRWIRIGFNSIFEPVIMVAKSQERQASNFDLIIDFDKAMKLGPTSAVFQKLFDNTWLQEGSLKNEQYCHPGYDGWGFGSPFIIHPRHQWPDRKYSVKALNLLISFSIVADAKRDASSESRKKVWAIDVTAMKPTATEKKGRLRSFLNPDKRA